MATILCVDWPGGTDGDLHRSPGPGLPSGYGTPGFLEPLPAGNLWGATVHGYFEAAAFVDLFPESRFPDGCDVARVPILLQGFDGSGSVGFRMAGAPTFHRSDPQA